MTFKVSFPGPMVTAKAINAGGAVPPIVITPSISGAFLWKSVTDGEFTLSGPIAPGTHYVVSTAPGLKGAAGAPVHREKWEFDSEVFTVQLDDDRENRDDAVSNRPHIPLRANYPVSIVDAAEAIYFQDRDSHERLPAEILLFGRAIGGAGERIHGSAPGSRFRRAKRTTWW